MNKGDYNTYLQLEKGLELDAMEIYKWYSDEIEELYNVEQFHITFSHSENNFLYFDGEEYLGEWSSVAKVLPLEILFFTDDERKAYADKYHKDKEERYRIGKLETQKQIQLSKSLARTERYETYLELKKEFEDGKK